MRTFVCAIWILTVSLVSAQVSSIDSSKERMTTVGQMKVEPINIGYSFKLHSNVLREERTIMIALPDDYEKSTKRYPVFYMVDAQWNFKQTTQTINTLYQAMV
jgi:enterochelin esterase-like enzyme